MLPHSPQQGSQCQGVLLDGGSRDCRARAQWDTTGSLKRRRPAIFNTMDGPGGPHPEGDKPDTERIELHDLTGPWKEKVEF